MSGYQVLLSYEDDFVKLMNKLQKKYPPELFDIHGIANKHLDINEFSKHFFRKTAESVADMSVDPNANISEKTIAQWGYEHSKGIAKVNGLYLMWKYISKLYSKKDASEVIELVLNGTIFVNDLHMLERPYCFGFDLMPLCMDGLKFFKGTMKIKAPTRADSFVDLVIQATAYLSNQIAGAVSFPTFFVNLDWYFRKDYGDDYIEKFRQDTSLKYKITNLFQRFIYSVNYPFRGAQSPFTNLSIMDKGFLNSLFGIEKGIPKYVNSDGTSVNIDSVYELQKEFYIFLNEIFGKEGIFTFPVTTLAASIDKNNNYIDPDFIQWVSEVYPDKCLANIYIGQPNSFSSCCRMKNDYKKINKYKEFQNSFGVGGISIGSTRVAGINFPKLAFMMKENNDTDYSEYVDYALSVCKKVLLAHRQIIKNHIEAGVLPLYDAGWIHLDKQYSTFGFIGAYEFLDILGKDITKEEDADYLIKMMKYIEKDVESWAKQYKIPTNIEQIPGESMAVRLADIDKLLGNNKDYEVDLYSNQYIPLSKNGSIYDRFKIQGKLDRLTSGGSILHLNIDDGGVITPKQMLKLMDVARQTGTVYFAVNRVFVKCVDEHYSISNNGMCPVCGKEVIQQYSRVVGFCTPVKSWHPARRQEFNNRVFYSNSDQVFAA